MGAEDKRIERAIITNRPAPHHGMITRGSPRLSLSRLSKRHSREPRDDVGWVVMIYFAVYCMDAMIYGVIKLCTELLGKRQR